MEPMNLTFDNFFMLPISEPPAEYEPIESKPVVKKIKIKEPMCCVLQ